MIIPLGIALAYHSIPMEGRPSSNQLRGLSVRKWGSVKAEYGPVEFKIEESLDSEFCI